MATLARATAVQTVFLAWQDHESRSWFPVGRLTFDGQKYRFVYIRGALEAQEQCGFQPLLSFPEWDGVYESDYLFPVFANRLMSPSRPEYRRFLERLNLDRDSQDLMAMLARCEGKRETDSLRVFPFPEQDGSGYEHLHFFAHGLRYLPNCSIERINRLEVREKLWLSHEFQNPYDPQALTLTTEDHHILGYCPRYLGSFMFDLLRTNLTEVKVRVERVNVSPTPLQFRLLCRLSYKNNGEIKPFSQAQYQPL